MRNKKHSFDKEVTAETKAGLGILIGGTIVATLAVLYLFGTTDGKKNRVIVRQWMADMKNELHEQLKKLQKVDKQVYFDIVDDMVNRYQKMDEVDADELIAFARELKRHYNTIHRQIDQSTKKPASEKKKKPARKTATKTKEKTTAVSSKSSKKSKTTKKNAAGK